MKRDDAVSGLAFVGMFFLCGTFRTMATFRIVAVVYNLLNCFVCVYDDAQYHCSWRSPSASFLFWNNGYATKIACAACVDHGFCGSFCSSFHCPSSSRMVERASVYTKRKNYEHIVSQNFLIFINTHWGSGTSSLRYYNGSYFHPSLENDACF